jgi:hypothetical protein
MDNILEKELKKELHILAKYWFEQNKYDPEIENKISIILKKYK